MRVVLLCRTSFDAGHVGGRDPQRGLASNSSSKTKRDLDKVDISTASCCTWAILYTYCWWKKSCTSWYGKYPMIYRVSYMLGGAGYSFSLQLPKTNINRPWKWWFPSSESPNFQGSNIFRGFCCLYYIQGLLCVRDPTLGTQTLLVS